MGAKFHAENINNDSDYLFYNFYFLRINLYVPIKNIGFDRSKHCSFRNVTNNEFTYSLIFHRFITRKFLN